MINPNKTNYYSFHYFQKHLSFPIALAAKTENESILIQTYLTDTRINNSFNVIAFIDWSTNHNIDYQIFFPNIIELLIHNPKKLLDVYAILKHIFTLKLL